ncbi:hypothetical protein HZS_5188 [Henneguya salminicola]|nr:hypothetical protein HZS_5188 [Henneguya salminicola]
MNYGFSLRLSIFQTQRFHIRRNRYNLVQCQQACGLALFINYPLTNEICLQVGSEIYYFKLHNYQDHLDISRVLLIELLTRYSSQTGEPIEVRRTFISRPCSMNEIEKRNIKSNLEIVVINSKEVNTSIYFVDVDLNRQGPFSIPIITNYTQKYSELINASLNITGLIFTNVSAFHQKNYDSRNPNAIVMIKGNITYRSCFAWNMILEVNNHTNEDIELGSEIYGFRHSIIHLSLTVLIHPKLEYKL